MARSDKHARSVGIREVAALSGVSTATVARVLRRTGQVSPELTERVERAVAELRYVPNAVARSLTRGRTGLVGLIIPDIANPFSAEVASGLQETVVNAGYHVVVASSGADDTREVELVASFAGHTVDAVVMMPIDDRADRIELLTSREIPVVLVAGVMPGSAVPAVVADNASAARRAVEYLFDLGHTDVAMISGQPGFYTVAAGAEGYRAAHEAAGIEVREDYIRQGFVGIPGGREAMSELIALDPRPTACIALNDLLTVGALTALREAALEVPADVSLISFDDMVMFAFADPQITAFVQPAYAMGCAVGELVLEAVRGELDQVADTRLLETDFRERDSCGPPPTAP